MISRRSFIAGALGVASSPLAAEAQWTKKVATIGFISERTIAPIYLDALRRGLAERSWVEGQNYRLEIRSADGNLERLPGLVADLIHLEVDLIVTGLGTPVALAVKRETAKIPLVFVTGGDPVAFGVISNRQKPGGNVTGFGGGIVINQKRIELLREVAPRVKRVAFLRNLANPTHTRIFGAAEDACRRLGLALIEVGVFEVKEFGDALKTMRSERLDALFVPGDAMFTANRTALVEGAGAARLPAIYSDRPFPEAGGLMSLSADFVELCRRAAGYVDKILRGTKAGDLPVEEADKFELIVNVKAAKSIGLTIPQSMLGRANEVLQ